jgi:hypothetical protein
LIGTGADFEDFAARIAEHLEPSIGTLRIGCLWPLAAHNAKVPTRPFVHFDSEYLELAEPAKELIIVAQAIVTSKDPIESVLERVTEKLGRPADILATAAMDKTSFSALSRQLRVIPVFSAERVTHGSETDLNYWNAERALDPRESKLGPRISMWLLDRMERVAKPDPEQSSSPSLI